MYIFFFFFSSRRRHTRSLRDWSSDVCSSDLNTGDGAAVGSGDTWTDTVYLHDLPDVHDSHAHVWLLAIVTRPSSLGPGASYTQTKTFQLSPAAQALYVTVATDSTFPNVAESHEDNNALTVQTSVL